MQTTTGHPESRQLQAELHQMRHFNVCTLIRAIAPLLGNWEEGHRPFEPPT